LEVQSSIEVLHEVRLPAQQTNSAGKGKSMAKPDPEEYDPDQIDREIASRMTMFHRALFDRESLAECDNILAVKAPSKISNVPSKHTPRLPD
jgi:hypothetical protein